MYKRQIISSIQKKEKILLNVRQKEGILRAFQYPVTIITGGPGRGKTTDISFIIEVEKILQDVYKRQSGSFLQYETSS